MSLDPILPHFFGEKNKTPLNTSPIIQMEISKLSPTDEVMSREALSEVT